MTIHTDMYDTGLIFANGPSKWNLMVTLGEGGKKEIEFTVKAIGSGPDGIKKKIKPEIRGIEILWSEGDEGRSVWRISGTFTDTQNRQIMFEGNYSTKDRKTPVETPVEFSVRLSLADL